MRRRQTKIVATLGPATTSREVVADLVRAGMNVARVNCSHGDWVAKRQLIQWVRETDIGLSPVGVLVDLQGPKFRLGEIRGGRVELATGQSVTLGPDPEALLPVPDGPIWEAMTKGSKVLLGDGEVQIRISDSGPTLRRGVVIGGGTVSSRKGLTLSGRSFDVPALTEKDRSDVEEATKYGADFVALSYVRRAADMELLRSVTSRIDPSIKLVAKVETREALKNLDEIIEASDVVMVARGDLGLQMNIEDVPLAQKRIISRCNRAGTTVITATQMLESMITNSRPTRAEASDVANAILDGSDAVMLSAETAAGQYPIEAVRTMDRIAQKVEKTLDSRPRLAARLDAKLRSTATEAVALAAVTLADALGVRAVLTTSASGTTPRMVSKFRPSVPILCASWNPRVQAQMSLVWGVESVAMPPTRNTDEAIAFLIESFVKRKWLKAGDQVVVTAGHPPGTPGQTNLLLVREA